MWADSSAVPNDLTCGGRVWADVLVGDSVLASGSPFGSSAAKLMSRRSDLLIILHEQYVLDECSSGPCLHNTGVPLVEMAVAAHETPYLASGQRCTARRCFARLSTFAEQSGQAVRFAWAHVCTSSGFHLGRFGPLWGTGAGKPCLPSRHWATDCAATP